MITRKLGSTTYSHSYDVENRLTEVTANTNSTVTQFSYDSQGQRTSSDVETPGVSKTVTHYPFPTYQEETRYLWQYHCEGGDEGSRCDYKWVEQAVVKKSNYFLAGQAIATRITGDPVSGNNGLFYFLTDYLGSTTMLITAAGAAVAGTAAYYQPYGSGRTSPPTTLTERGYTGHHENRDIGLTYMNARYYIPGLGRFLTADTLVPSPTNPQSHNRYSYVLGNPLVLVDPTGHASCYTHGQNEHCTDDTPMTPPPPRPQRPAVRPVRDIPQCDGCFLPTLPTSPPRGLNEWGLAAWNGLQAIQQMTGGWWGDELDALEALMLILNHELGTELGPNAHHAPLDALINQYNTYCSGGAWSTECLNKFWGYSHVIRESRVALDGGGRFARAEHVQWVRQTAAGFLNHTLQPVNPALIHYGNAFSESARRLLQDYNNGVMTYATYVNVSGYKPDPETGALVVSSVFVVQTYKQWRLTGTLQWWIYPEE